MIRRKEMIQTIINLIRKNILYVNRRNSTGWSIQDYIYLILDIVSKDLDNQFSMFYRQIYPYDVFIQPFYTIQEIQLMRYAKFLILMHLYICKNPQYKNASDIAIIHKQKFSKVVDLLSQKQYYMIDYCLLETFELPISYLEIIHLE